MGDDSPASSITAPDPEEIRNEQLARIYSFWNNSIGIRRILQQKGEDFDIQDIIPKELLLSRDNGI